MYDVPSQSQSKTRIKRRNVLNDLNTHQWDIIFNLYKYLYIYVLPNSFRVMFANVNTNKFYEAWFNRWNKNIHHNDIKRK